MSKNAWRGRCPDRTFGWRGPADIGHGAVPHDLGQLGHERLDRHRGQGRRDDGDRHSTRHHPLHPCHGRIHDHGRQGRADHRAAPRLHDRLRHLRDRLVDDRVGSFVARAARRLVDPRRARGNIDHALGGGTGRHQLRRVRASSRLRLDRLGQCDRRRRRPADRGALHDLSHLACGLRRRGGPGRGHPRPVETGRRCAARNRRPPRPDRNRPLGGWPRLAGVRCDPRGRGDSCNPNRTCRSGSVPHPSSG